MSSTSEDRTGKTGPGKDRNGCPELDPCPYCHGEIIWMDRGFNGWRVAMCIDCFADWTYDIPNKKWHKGRNTPTPLETLIMQIDRD